MDFPDDLDQFRTYVVVVNAEEQYSMWPADREIPQGWRDTGKRGSKDDCLAYIKEVWGDKPPALPRKRIKDDSGQG